MTYTCAEETLNKNRITLKNDENLITNVATDVCTLAVLYSNDQMTRTHVSRESHLALYQPGTKEDFEGTLS